MERLEWVGSKVGVGVRFKAGMICFGDHNFTFHILLTPFPRPALKMEEEDIRMVGERLGNVEYWKHLWYKHVRSVG